MISLPRNSHKCTDSILVYIIYLTTPHPTTLHCTHTPLTHSCSYSLTHAHSFTLTTPTPTHSHPLPHSLTHTHSLPLLTSLHLHSLTLTPTHSHSLPLTPTHSHSLTFTLTHNHAEKKEWETFFGTGEVPSGRSRAAMVVYQDKVSIIMGGGEREERGRREGGEREERGRREGGRQII